MNTASANHALTAPTMISADWHCALDAFAHDLRVVGANAAIEIFTRKCREGVPTMDLQQETCDYPAPADIETLLADYEQTRGQDWDDPEEFDYHMDQVELEIEYSIEYAARLAAPSCTALDV